MPDLDLPFLDLTAPSFSTRSDEVMKARRSSWCARTPFGLAVLRHRQAGQLLRDRRLRQGSHAWPAKIGISGSFAAFWQRSIISLEGDRHRILRQIVQAALAEDAVLALGPDFETLADKLVNALADNPQFDFVSAFTEPFAGRAIARLMSVPDSEAGVMARDASTLGLAMGPEAKQHEAKVNAACNRLLALAESLIQKLPKEGFVARLLHAAETAGYNDRQSLVDLVVISIFGGVDTTRAQLAFAIHLFATHGTQWEWLRHTPDKVPQALEEVIRTRPTTTWASREALEDFNFCGVDIEVGETIHILVHASGTDPDIGEFKGFDIREPRKTHFGFGGGAHHCLGHFVARTDMAAALTVLLRRWSSIQLVGEPEFLPDSGNTSPRKLWIAPDWA